MAYGARAAEPLPGGGGGSAWPVGLEAESANLVSSPAQGERNANLTNADPVK